MCADNDYSLHANGENSRRYLMLRYLMSLYETYLRFIKCCQHGQRNLEERNIELK